MQTRTLSAALAVVAVTACCLPLTLAIASDNVKGLNSFRKLSTESLELIKASLPRGESIPVLTRVSKLRLQHACT